VDKAASFAVDATAHRSTLSLAAVVIINFKRHFLYLTSVTLVLAAIAAVVEASDEWARVAPGDGVLLFFFVVGSLHAVSLAVASSEPRSFPKKLFFIVSAGILSIGVAFLGITVANIPYVEYLATLMASAFGGAPYWWIIRYFVIHKLGMRSLLMAVAFCVGGTLASALLGVLFSNLGNYITLLAGLLPTVCWWYAFSLSLWVSMRNNPTANNRFERSRAASSVS
jgi:hypothetical protein